MGPNFLMNAENGQSLFTKNILVLPEAAIGGLTGVCTAISIIFEE